MAFRSAATNSGTAASPTVNAPSGVTDGDIVLICLSQDDNTGGGSVTCSGFTALYDVETATPDGRLTVLWKVASSEGSSYTVTRPNTTGDWHIASLAYSGRAASIDQSSTANETSSGSSPVTVTATTITPTADNADVVWVGGTAIPATGTTTWTAPSTYNNRADVADDDKFSGLLVCDITQTSATATGSVSGTMTYAFGTARGIGVIFSLLLAGPNITDQPDDVTATLPNPGSATFSITATGTGTLHYQWKKNGSNVGTDSNSYTASGLAMADDKSIITCVVSDDAGSSTSREALLTVRTVPPVFLFKA